MTVFNDIWTASIVFIHDCSISKMQLYILPKIKMVNKVIEQNQENLSNPKCVYMSVCQGSAKGGWRQLCPRALSFSQYLVVHCHSDKWKHFMAATVKSPPVIPAFSFSFSVKSCHEIWLHISKLQLHDQIG